MDLYQLRPRIRICVLRALSRPITCGGAAVATASGGGEAEKVLRGSLSAAMPLGVAVRFWLDAAAAMQ